MHFKEQRRVPHDDSVDLLRELVDVFGRYRVALIEAALE